MEIEFAIGGYRLLAQIIGTLRTVSHKFAIVYLQAGRAAIE